jgi:polyphenol oxidase
MEEAEPGPGADRARHDAADLAAESALTWSLVGGAEVAFTSRHDGDMGGSGSALDARRRSVVDLAWSVPRQVHGAEVVVVDQSGAGHGVAADALVSAIPGVALAVLTADCAPVAFSSAEGVLGVAHAGWRGLQAGVLEATVAAMRQLGATDVDAVLGPCIHPCCYEFGAADLAGLVDQFGPTVASRDRSGRPALDVPAGVEVALAGVGVSMVGQVATCTGCFEMFYSWRVRRDQERQATVVWR